MPAIAGLRRIEDDRGVDMAVERDLSGTVLAGRYRVLSQIGGGGMGTVHAGEHVEVGRKVAIKILLPEAVARPTLVERFRREARLTARIEHEHVVECLDVGVTDDGLCFYVMEWLRGEDLQAVLRREGSIAWPRARAIVAQVCRALAAAHAGGVIHRDLKPSNIFLVTREGTRDFVKVVDFGVAKLMADSELPGEALTRTGEVVGTTPYMSPELAAGEPFDHRIDIYAAGVILFQCLAGRLPYRGKTPRQILAEILKGDTPRVSEINPKVQVSPELEALLRRALHREAGERFPDMAALHDALLELPDDACTPVDAAVIDPSASESAMARSIVGPMAAGDRNGRASSSGATSSRPDEAPTVLEVVAPRPRRRGWKLFAGLGALTVIGAAALVLVPGSPLRAWAGMAAQEVVAAPVVEETVPAGAADPGPEELAVTPEVASAEPVIEAPVVEPPVVEPPVEVAEAPVATGDPKPKRSEPHSDFDEVMRRAGVRVRRCLSQRGVKAGTRLRFDVVVEARTGRIRSATARGAAGGQTLGACVVDAALGSAVRPAPANEWHRSYEITA